MKRSLLLLLVMVCFIIETSAQIIHIPTDFSTIQAGIESSDNGDTVIVAEGTYFENINFNGKAITVASRFILDGDTSHISKTIIDGSKSTNPDTASVVIMWSGEDTTSVLMGLTITGGTGTDYTNLWGSWERGGGGILIKGSGGKIIHNVIKGNHVNKPGSELYLSSGGGILAVVYNNHSAIIRENIIKYNQVTALTSDQSANGGGMRVGYGRIICEYNEITNNTVRANAWSFGGGVTGGFLDEWDGVEIEGVIKEAILRNNLISDNYGYSTFEIGGGGGYSQHLGYGYREEYIQFYNNIICNNHTNGSGGGFYFEDAEGSFFNNTIIDNTAESDGNCIAVYGTSKITLYNNIMWRYVSTTRNEFYWMYPVDTARMLLCNNILMEPFEEHQQLTELNNVYTEPIFQSGSYELAENSPGIGWGIDTVQIDTTWYYSPSFDFNGNPRPNPIDGWGDLGAIESAFAKLPNPNLAHIGLWDRKLCPDFHKDTLHYVLPVPDSTIVTPKLDVVTEDWAAEVDINNADSIGSPDPADRTTTITVTAHDGTTRKIYTVLFRFASKDATLNHLSISKGTLEPDFNPDAFIYTVCLPVNETETPTVTYESTDANANVLVEYAPEIRITNPLPNYRPFRTTFMTVTSEDGRYKTIYEIEHLLDKTIPEITLAGDTVYLNGNIEVSSTEDGYIYLVPENTPKNLDSIKVHRIDSSIVTAGVTAFIDTAITGTYSLYAIDNCLNISKAVTVTIIDTSGTGKSENMVASVRLYPNPVDRILYFETAQTISSVELFNVIGVMVLDKSKPEGWIDMSQLEQGVYFVKIRTESEKIYTIKVMKK